MKKLLWILFLFCPLLMEAQNDSICSELIEYTEDIVDGSRDASSQKFVITKEGTNNGISLLLMKTSTSPNVVSLSISVLGEKTCIDKESQIVMVFDDSSKITLLNNREFKCDGFVFLYFGGIFGNKRELKVLSVKWLLIVRVYTSEGYVQVEVPEETAEEIKNTFSCLSNYKFK